MLVRHNTALLEQAVDLAVKRAAIPTMQAQAEAEARVARALGFRRLATGVAISLAAVGIGLGIMLGLWRDEPGLLAESQRVQPELPARMAPSEPPSPPSTTKLPTAPEGGGSANSTTTPSPRPVPPTKLELPSQPPVVTTNFTKFRTVHYEFGGRTWQLEAGHYFDSENDAAWKYAWCYARKIVDGVEVNISLAERLPTGLPVGPVASRSTLQRVGLNDADAVNLAMHCAWMDGRRFSEFDFVQKAGRDTEVVTSNQPQSEATPPSPEFRTISGWDAPGNDLAGMPLRDVTIEQCQVACETNFQCLALTFNTRFGACFLKGDAVEATKSPDAVMMVREVIAGSILYRN